MWLENSSSIWHRLKLSCLMAMKRWMLIVFVAVDDDGDDDAGPLSLNYRRSLPMWVGSGKKVARKTSHGTWMMIRENMSLRRLLCDGVQVV